MYTRQKEYVEKYIPGVQNVPLDRLTEHLSEFYPELYVRIFIRNHPFLL